jgi:hypothetical protein
MNKPRRKKEVAKSRHVQRIRPGAGSAALVGVESGRLTSEAEHEGW